MARFRRTGSLHHLAVVLGLLLSCIGGILLRNNGEVEAADKLWISKAIHTQRNLRTFLSTDYDLAVISSASFGALSNQVQAICNNGTLPSDFITQFCPCLGQAAEKYDLNQLSGAAFNRTIDQMYTECTISATFSNCMAKPEQFGLPASLSAARESALPYCKCLSADANSVATSSLYNGKIKDQSLQFTTAMQRECLSKVPTTAPPSTSSSSASPPSPKSAEESSKSPSPGRDVGDLSNNDSSSSLSAGAIVGIVFGSILFTGLVAIFGIYFLRRTRQSNNDGNISNAQQLIGPNNPPPPGSMLLNSNEKEQAMLHNARPIQPPNLQGYGGAGGSGAYGGQHFEDQQHYPALGPLPPRNPQVEENSSNLHSGGGGHNMQGGVGYESQPQQSQSLPPAVYQHHVEEVKYNVHAHQPPVAEAASAPESDRLSHRR